MVLLPGVEIPKVDVTSKPRIAGSPAAHDTEQAHVTNAPTLISSISNRVRMPVVCHVDRKQISRSQPVESGSDLGVLKKVV